MTITVAAPYRLHSLPASGRSLDLFKDTTLVSIVGLFELMGVINQSLKDPNWLGLAMEGYTFAAVLFFGACMLISLAGQVLERRFGSAAVAPRR